MFSFFKSKKSPIASPTEPARAEDNVQKADEFVVINPGGPAAPLYPSAQLPHPPPQGHVPFNRQHSLQIANYTQHVPFKLSAALSSNTTSDSEIWDIRLREMNNQFSRITTDDYSFSLERSIVQQN